MLGLQRRLEPKHIKEEGEVDHSKPVRAVRRVILFNPAFGESEPGKPFPYWLIPSKLRPPDCGEWTNFALLRTDLTQDDLLDDDPFSRCLRGCLRDPRRLELLTYRKDLKPQDIERVTDGAHIGLLKVRRDLYPGDLQRLGRGLQNQLRGTVPLQSLGYFTNLVMNKSIGLMLNRPDLKVSQLTQLMANLRRNSTSTQQADLPYRFMAAINLMHQDSLLTPEDAAHKAPNTDHSIDLGTGSGASLAASLASASSLSASVGAGSLASSSSASAGASGAGSSSSSSSSSASSSAGGAGGGY